MPLLLINPPLSFEGSNIWNRINSCTPPLGLALLAAILENDGYQCDICDCPADGLSIDDILDKIRIGGYNLVGITSVTVNITVAIKLSKLIKTKFDSVKIVLGGVHASIFYKTLMSETSLDYIIRKEGELSLLQLVRGDNLSAIPNLSFRQKNKIVHNQERTDLYDLSQRPVLAYHKLPMKNYHAAFGAAKRKPSIGMIVSRGCPGTCTFCYNGMFGKQIRFLPARKIIEEITLLQKMYGIREISFYDDTFTSNHKIVREYCESIIKTNLNITWSCFARVDTVNPELLILMKRAGCHQIMYGLESGSEEILSNIHKKVDLETNRQAVKMTQKAGIAVRAAFMIGNAGESESTIKQTIKYAIKLEPDLAIFNVATPFPGTELYNWAYHNNHLVSSDWSDYDLSKPVMNVPGLSSDRIACYYKLAYKAFYLRVGYFIRRLYRIRGWDDLRNNIEGIRFFLKF